MPQCQRDTICDVALSADMQAPLASQPDFCSILAECKVRSWSAAEICSTGHDAAGSLTTRLHWSPVALDQLAISCALQLRAHHCRPRRSSRPWRASPPSRSPSPSPHRRPRSSTRPPAAATRPGFPRRRVGRRPAGRTTRHTHARLVCRRRQQRPDALRIHRREQPVSCRYPRAAALACNVCFCPT